MGDLNNINTACLTSLISKPIWALPLSPAPLRPLQIPNQNKGSLSMKQEGIFERHFFNRQKCLCGANVLLLSRGSRQSLRTCQLTLVQSFAVMHITAAPLLTRDASLIASWQQNGQHESHAWGDIHRYSRRCAFQSTAATSSDGGRPGERTLSHCHESACSSVREDNMSISNLFFFQGW